MTDRFSLFPLCVALALAGCAGTKLPPQDSEQFAAAFHLHAAERKTVPAEQRAVDYLQAASAALGLLDSGTAGGDARAIYNQAAADLTVLLSSGNNGRLWNQPLTLGGSGRTFHLRFARGTRDGVWDPVYFTSFVPAAEVPDGNLERRNLRDGIGGTLVGVRQMTPRETFATPAGINGAVTVTLDFKGSEVVLTLLDPAKAATVKLAGKARPLAADYSAPLAHYPQSSELWNGLMAAMRAEKYMGTTGLYMIQPYDPDLIPLILVHGLVSTPRMWRNVINELESDPEFRGRYQCWLFGYPTGNPPLYSAQRFREELAKVRHLHPAGKDYVLVGHSMGGLVSRMQATTVTRESWDVIGKDKAAKFFARVKPGDLVDQSTSFHANPHVARMVFICTPHRGSEMADGRMSAIAARLISLPGNVTAAINRSVGDSVAIVTGDPHRMPTSANGLSPRNPTFQVLEHNPPTAPHHSIIGDRGKGDSPNSSDGVVSYSSSHLDSARSECIVPGPHGACELPETLAELRRILQLHLKEADGRR